MSRVLFLNQPSVGHVTTLLNIARQLKDDGGQPSFLVPGLNLPRTRVQVIDSAMAITALVRANDLPVDTVRPSLSVFWSGLFLTSKTGYDEIVTAVNFMAVGVEHYARQVLKKLERQRPDAIVTDFAFLAGGLAAEVLKIPYAAVYHSGLPFRGAGVPPFGSGLPIGADADAVRPYAEREKELLARLDDKINAVRRRLGLPPVADLLRTPYSPWLNLVASVSAAEAPRDHLPPTTVFVGPCFGKRKQHAAFPFDALAADRFKVYVSLGTMFNNRPDFFRTIMAALDRPEYQLIISAGGAYRALQAGPAPANTLLFPSVPQAELLPRVDLFITHGGNNSVNECLAAGKPMVVVPVGGEQGDNASRLTYLGVGRRLDIARLDPAEVRAAVDELRTQPSVREQSERIRQAVQAADGVATAARCVRWLAERRQPLLRPEGCPLTITRAEWGRLLGEA